MRIDDMFIEIKLSVAEAVRLMDKLDPYDPGLGDVRLRVEAAANDALTNLKGAAEPRALTTSDLNNDERLFLQTGNKIGAIKSLRMRFGRLGLREAKDICDRYEGNLICPDIPPPPSDDDVPF